MCWHEIFNWIVRIIKYLVRAILNKNKNTESMKVYKNIDVVQINIKAGVREYFLPKNVDWADKVIDKIVLYSSPQELEVTSPVDRITKVLDQEEISALYFDFYSSEEKEIANNLEAKNILYTNNNCFELNSKISLQLSKIFFAEASPNDGCLLLYIFYGTKTVENVDIPKRNVTVQIPISAGEEITLSDVIDTYIHATNGRVKGILSWGSLTSGLGNFITLRDHNYRTIIKDLPITMCRPPMLYDGLGTYESAEQVQVDSLYLDNEDVDFANSYIQNTFGENGTVFPITLTFLY